MKKGGCGLISVNEKALGLFGGYGIGPIQHGSRSIKNSGSTDGRGWTNEFHLFEIEEGEL